MSTTFWLAALLAALMFVYGCTPMVTELADSSGCLFSTGGPIPGMASGVVVVCRSGKDQSNVVYRDAERTIEIKH